MHFVTLFKFTSQGLAGIGDTTKRAQQFAEGVSGSGIKIRELLWLQGRYDGLVVFEAPDTETATATILKLASRGNVQTETLVAFDAAAMDQILSRT